MEDRFSFSFDDHEVEQTAPVRTSRGRLAVLTVCTGNIARSALAEAHLRAAAAGAGIELTVSSAGTEALVGVQVPAELLLLTSVRGLDLNDHRGRQLTAELIAASDLVLTATREQRSAAVRLAPASRSSVFTLREFVRVAREVRSVEGTLPLSRDLIIAAIETRPALVPLLDPDEDDILDPYRRPLEVYRQMATAVISAVDELLGVPTVAG